MMKFKQLGGLAFLVMFFVLLAGCSDDSTGPEVIENSVAISSGPEGADAFWALELPSGLLVTGSRDTTLTEMDPGVYELKWGYSAGWSDIPEDSSQELLAGESISFTGDYGYHISGAVTPDILMGNFKFVYESMSPGFLMGLLSPDYRTIILQDTFDDWQDSENPLAEMYFDYETTETIHANLFGGLGGFDESGLNIPPIDSISISVWDKDGAWDLVDEGVDYFGGRGAYMARYNVLMHFYKPDGNRFEIDQTFEVYVVQEEDDLFYLLGVRGLGYWGQSNSKAATDRTTYDQVLSLYR